MTDKTSIGDRMKGYEAPETDRKAFKGQPLIARLDGHAFHTFTRGLRRPYDERLSSLMVDVTKALVDRFGATVGYTQSDEITLAWYSPPESQVEYPFSGRLHKMDSLLAARASVHFFKQLPVMLPEKAGQELEFDCRAFVVPNLQEAYHAFLWRQQDAVKNAISAAGQSMFSHRELQFLSGPQMQEKMWAEKGVNFNDYPAFFKRGTFVRRVKEERVLTEEQLEAIPPKHRPTGPVLRSFIDECDIWLTKQSSGVGVLFHGEPITAVSAPDVPLNTGYQDPLALKARLH